MLAIILLLRLSFSGIFYLRRTPVAIYTTRFRKKSPNTGTHS